MIRQATETRVGRLVDHILKRAVGHPAFGVRRASLVGHAGSVWTFVPNAWR
jgi:hypothetical protein